MLKAELKVLEGKQAGVVIPLSVRRFLIGREQDCQLRAASDLVSRHHCVISVDDFTVRIRDLGSTNGTFVNGLRIDSSVTLKGGDRIQIGKLAFVLQVEAPVSVSVGGPLEDRVDEPEVVSSSMILPGPLTETEIPTSAYSEETTLITGKKMSTPSEAAPPPGPAPEPPTALIEPIAPPAAEKAIRRVAAPPLVLPPPESTGVDLVQVAANAAAATAAQAAADAVNKPEPVANPSNAAASIIKARMLNRKKPE